MSSFPGRGGRLRRQIRRHKGGKQPYLLWQLRCLEGCLQGCLGSIQNLQPQVEESGRLQDLGQMENGRPLGAVFGSGPWRLKMKGAGRGGGAAQDGGRLPATVFLSWELTFWHDGFLGSQKSWAGWDLEKGTTNTCPVSGPELGGFLNCVLIHLTLLGGRYPYPHFLDKQTKVW